jgi:hypothetical protein
MKATAALCMERADCMMGVANKLALGGTTLMMEPANSSKTPVINYQSIICQNTLMFTKRMTVYY